MTVLKSFDITIAVRRLPPLTAEALTQALADLGLRVVLPRELRIDHELRYAPVRVLLDDGTEVRTGLSITLASSGESDDDEDDEDDEDLEGSDERDEDDDEDEEADDDDGDADEEDDAEEEDDNDADDAADEDDEDEEADDDDGDADEEEEDIDADADDDGDEDDDDTDETPLIDGQIAELCIWAKNAPTPADENEVPLALYVATAIARLGDGEVLVHDWDGDSRSVEEMLPELGQNFAADADAWTEYPYALFLAAEDGDAAAVAAAVAAAAPVDALNNQGVTPLMIALANDRPAAAWELLRSGAKARAVNYFGKTAVEYADDCSDEWLRGEIARRARFPHDELFELIAEGDSNGVLAALAAGAPVNATTPEGFTLLMAAVRAEDENLVDALLKRGASVELTTQSGSSALDVAIAVGNVALEKVLRSMGAKHHRR